MPVRCQEVAVVEDDHTVAEPRPALLLVVGYTDSEGRPVGGGGGAPPGYISPDADRAVRGGSGLY